MFIKMKEIMKSDETRTSLWPGQYEIALQRRKAHWSETICFVSLLVLMLPAYSATYEFPGNLPKKCVGNSSGTYTCTDLTLVAGDTLTVSVPTTITIDGDLKVGMGGKINAGGAASKLTLVIIGMSTFGDNSIINANIIGGETVTSGAKSAITGNITTTSGVVNVGEYGSVVGAITTSSAAINTGDFSTITGPITIKIAGVVTVGNDASVIGDITTGTGAVNIGQRSKIDGAITTLIAGAITVGTGAIVTHSVATTYKGSAIGAGAVTIGDIVQVNGSVTTNTGAITVGTSSSVSNDVRTNDGAVTVGINTSVGGSVCTGNSGAITIGDNSSVGGDVETVLAGAITVGAQSIVSGSVTVKGAGAKTVATSAKVGTKIGGTCDTVMAKSGSQAPPTIKARQWRQIFMRQ